MLHHVIHDVGNPEGYSFSILHIISKMDKELAAQKVPDALLTLPVCGIHCTSHFSAGVLEQLHMWEAARISPHVAPASTSAADVHVQSKVSAHRAEVKVGEATSNRRWEKHPS